VAAIRLSSIRQPAKRPGVYPGDLALNGAQVISFDQAIIAALPPRPLKEP
jgi:hypothetical protein